MTENPYSSPATVEIAGSAPDRFRLLYASAFWITAGISLVQTFAAMVIVGSNLWYKLSTGNPLPPYIYSLFLLVPACAVGFGYSALQWRRRKPVRALFAFAGATFATLVGPRILLALLW